MKNKIIATLLVVMSHDAHSHYQVKNVKTTTEIFSFDLVHVYLPSHETNHPNMCKRLNENSRLTSCTLNYKVVSRGNNKEIKTGFVDLRGDGSYDDELMNATTHYNSLRIAESHGVNLTQLVDIPRKNITSLTGGNNQYTVSTSSAGSVCDASLANCQNKLDSGYTTDTLNFNLMTDLQVACEFTSKDLSIKTALSEDNLYYYYGDDSKKIIPYEYNADSILFNCVNWLSNNVSKSITLRYEPLSKSVSDGDTLLECKLFGDIDGNSQPASPTTTMTILGFSTKNQSFKIPEAFLGFYVFSPSGSAQTSTEFNCDFKLAIGIK